MKAEGWAVLMPVMEHCSVMVRGSRRPALFKWEEKQEIRRGEVWVKAWKSSSISLDCTWNCKRASLACLDNDIFVLTFEILILAAVGRLQGRGKSESNESAWGERWCLLHRRLREALRNGIFSLYRKAIQLTVIFNY